MLPPRSSARPTGRTRSTSRAAGTALEPGGDLEAAAGAALFARWVSEARLLNSADYAARAAADPRYAAGATARCRARSGAT